MMNPAIKEFPTGFSADLLYLFVCFGFVLTADEQQVASLPLTEVLKTKTKARSYKA